MSIELMSTTNNDSVTPLVQQNSKRWSSFFIGKLNSFLHEIKQLKIDSEASLRLEKLPTVATVRRRNSEIRRLKKKILECKSKEKENLTQVFLSVKELAAENSVLKEENASLKTKVNGLEEIVNKKSSELELNKTKVDILKQEITAWEIKSNTWQFELQFKQSELKDLREEYASLSEKSTHLKVEERIPAGKEDGLNLVSTFWASPFPNALEESEKLDNNSDLGLSINENLELAAMDRMLANRLKHNFKKQGPSPKTPTLTSMSSYEPQNFRVDPPIFNFVPTQNTTSQLHQKKPTNKNTTSRGLSFPNTSISSNRVQKSTTNQMERNSGPPKLNVKATSFQPGGKFG